MVNTKFRYLTLFLVIVVFLISSCATQPQQTVCNKPYIHVGSECCLDEDNNNICDQDEKKEDSQPKAELAVSENLSEQSLEEQTSSTLITNDASQLALYSNEIIAGYSLNIKNSGIYQYDLEDDPALRQVSLIKTFVTSYTKSGTAGDGDRWLTFYSRTFETIDGAGEGYKLIKEKIKEKSYYQERKWISIQKTGDEITFFMNEYNYNFVPYIKYVGLLRIKNIIIEIILDIPGNEEGYNEWSNYMEEVAEKVLQGDILPSEASSSSISQVGLREDLIEVKVNEIERKKFIKKSEGYEYFKIDSLVGTDKEYLILNLYLRNLAITEGFETSYNKFILIDENGNYYTAHRNSIVLEDSRGREKLSKGNGMGTAYFFPVLKNAEEFTLTIYNENVEVYKIKI